MADFLTAMRIVFAHETNHYDGGDGAYNNRPNDQGGPTKWGISLKFLRLVQPDATEADIRNMPRDKALDLYRRYFWQALPLDQVIDQTLATKLMDMQVNMVSGAPTKILQRALNHLGESLVVDGGFGPKTLEAANRRSGIILTERVVAEQCEHYQAIVRKDPSQAGFLSDWLHRAAWPHAHTEAA